MLDSLLNEKDACGVGFIYRPKESHKVVAASLTALKRLEHRGACSADGVSGDGAGLLTAIPWQVFEEEGWKLAELKARDKVVAVVVCFMPEDHLIFCRDATEEAYRLEQFEIIGWRKVPVDKQILGPLARQSCPEIEQLFLAISAQIPEREIDSRLTNARKRLIHHVWDELGDDSFYLSSNSTRTISYKAMVRASSLGDFYADLRNQSYESKWAIFHRRFSTNTVPKWRLAQPFRLLAHNGEINTLQGNRNWLTARQQASNRLDGSICGLSRLGRLLAPPLVYIGSSDSANLDNVLEFLVNSGGTPEEAVMKLMPEAGRQEPLTAEDSAVADFYEYNAALQEPWDGPALIVYSDGRTLGSALDRNGLRPARYMRLKDGTIVLASETGIYDAAATDIVERGRLGPAEILSIDLETGIFSRDRTIKRMVAQQKPYAELLLATRQELSPCTFIVHALLPAAELTALQTSAGFGAEDVDFIIKSMAESGSEPVFSMGDDTALACLSDKPRLIYDYLKQRFAQVTNPPIDHLRERLVMSLSVYLCSAAKQTIKLASPFLSEAQLAGLIGSVGTSFNAQRLSLRFNPEEQSLEKALNQVVLAGERLAEQGTSILILSDLDPGSNRPAIPPLLVTGALHHRLIDLGLRTQCAIVVETAQCWSVHHFACLLSYGAQAVCPYLALETVRSLAAAHGTGPESLQTWQENYKKSIENGLLKVISKMGISTLSSYIGAQIMECVGVDKSVVSVCFKGTSSPAGAVSFSDIERDTLRFHSFACGASALLDNEAADTGDGLPHYGFLKHRKDGEFHGNNPAQVEVLHEALGLRKSSPDEATARQLFHRYSTLIKDRPAAAVRDLLTYAPDRTPTSVSEVEPAQEIARRFCTGGMSLGALSKETHETLAIAMNRLGGRSNSGEGGEDPVRYHPIADIGPDGTSPHFPGLSGLKPGDRAGSAIRQVASARFGVTAEYLATSDQLEIKIAQGAKPGEGGQLPGSKVSPYIARLRLAKPGITLISPPPHHDIYSIEDLAQLIFDLREVNPHAKISVKLVSSAGIGTIAAGVAKAGADIIQVSGHDGGTGAAPLTSIKHAGMPWEFGLADTHRTLVANGLREKVLLRVDGGLRTGWDVVTAAMLGANEFGFGSIALISQGCIMARVCHTNNCPVGITSQKESLRKKFRGTPDHLVQFFLFLAEEVRHELAQLGFKSVQEVIGRVDLLGQRKQSLQRPAMDLSCLLAPLPEAPKFPVPTYSYSAQRASDANDLISNPELIEAIETNGQMQKSCSITNRDRAIGARIAGAIARKWGDDGFSGLLKLRFAGSAGQSFGAFIVKGMQMELVGDANDYVGKGMSGGQIVVRNPNGVSLPSRDNVLAGNTCLYGATGGALFIAGRAGERFAVRNCNAVAVVEGAGDHCCEYMTGGTVVVLGEVGRNFGAGMTGGTAYVLDEHNEFEHKFNPDCEKTLKRVSGRAVRDLKLLILRHQRLTGSQSVRHILDNWQNLLPYFWAVTTPGQDGIEEVPGTHAQEGLAPADAATTGKVQPA